ncbi:MAG: LysR family transcriptional regulator [Pseudomonadota bacterium]
MDRLQALQVFLAVAQAESFVGGARAMGLSAPSATRGINALEESLGTRLFTRTTRTVRLTDAGKTYFEDVRQIIDHLQDANDTVSGSALRPIGRLRLTCSHEFGRIYVLPIVRDYLDAYPDMEVDMVMVDRIVNLVEEGFDLAVRLGSLPSSDLSAVRVGQVRRVVCGAPRYFKQHGVPATPEALVDHKVIAIGAISRSPEWKFGTKLQKVVKLRPRLTVSSVAAGIEAARAGWGLTRVLSYQIGPDLAKGTLETVLEDFEPEHLPIHLVHVEGRRAPAKVRSFIDLARERLRKNPALE